MSGSTARALPNEVFIPQGRVVLRHRSRPVLSLVHPLKLPRVTQRRPSPNNELRVLFLSFLSFSTAVVLALSLSVLSSVNENVPNVASLDTANSPSWYNWFSSSNSDSASYARLLQNRDLASKVNFVSEVISKNYKDVDARHLARTIVRESEVAGLDPLFVASVIKSESSFRRNARSPAGALGLMQVLPNTGKYVSNMHNFGWYGSWKLVEPSYNIKIGTAYLKYLNKKFKGNTEHVLIAYNWGPNNLLSALRSATRIPGSTVKYAKTIIGNHKNWKNEFVQSKPRLQYLEASLHPKNLVS